MTEFKCGTMLAQKPQTLRAKMPMTDSDTLPTLSRRAFGRCALFTVVSTISFLHLPLGLGQESQLDFSTRMFRLGEEFKEKLGDRWSAVNPKANIFIPKELEKSFVPALGKIVWELPRDVAKHVSFSARIYEISDGRHVGYVRVPHYDYDEDTIREFSKVIGNFENSTAALVFDQVNNPGGSMIHMYAMLSFLTDRSLSVPKHQFTLSDEDASMASDIVQRAEAGDDTVSRENLAYSRFVLSEIAAGRKRLTNPGFLAGVKEVVPENVHYTKKIIVLNNERTFSAGEFLAAILQDNKRATLFGQRTPGAGGCAKRFEIPGGKDLGIESITITWTIGWRTSGQPIENLGVHPDVSYPITVEDLRSGYSGYRKALLEAIDF